MSKQSIEVTFKRFVNGSEKIIFKTSDETTTSSSSSILMLQPVTKEGKMSIWEHIQMASLFIQRRSRTIMGCRT